jgi:hypothetical protein
MKLLTQERYRELQDAERRLELGDKDTTKLERRLNRQHQAEVIELAERHEDELDELSRDHRAELRKAEAKVEDAETKAKTAQKVADKAADATIEKALSEQKAQHRGNQATILAREIKVDTAELAVKARETRVEAREKAVEAAEKEFTGKVKAHAEETIAARKEGEEIGEKRGYANGSADMARSIGDLTKEDRRQAASMGDKALDAVVAAAKKDVPAPVVNALSVPTTTIVEKTKK